MDNIVAPPIYELTTGWRTNNEARELDDMERELPFNPYEVCRTTALERITFKVGDTQIVFEPRLSPSHDLEGIGLLFRQIVKGKLYARSEFVPRDKAENEESFNAKFNQLLDAFEQSLNREL